MSAATPRSENTRDTSTSTLMRVSLVTPLPMRRSTIPSRLAVPGHSWRHGTLEDEEHLYLGLQHLYTAYLSTLHQEGGQSTDNSDSLSLVPPANIVINIITFSSDIIINIVTFSSDIITDIITGITTPRYLLFQHHCHGNTPLIHPIIRSQRRASISPSRTSPPPYLRPESNRYNLDSSGSPNPQHPYQHFYPLSVLLPPATARLTAVLQQSAGSIPLHTAGRYNGPQRFLGPWCGGQRRFKSTLLTDSLWDVEAIGQREIGVSWSALGAEEAKDIGVARGTKDIVVAMEIGEAEEAEAEETREGRWSPVVLLGMDFGGNSPFGRVGW
ncbi:hypothetical protein M426DRAFT_20214 [Hypoxylon sp. CI-4A]|nr:hypothetical protein M426DRAFT_20214 [Hypoxylon sp. CI-4A]